MQCLTNAICVKVRIKRAPLVCARTISLYLRAMPLCHYGCERPAVGVLSRGRHHYDACNACAQMIIGAHAIVSHGRNRVVVPTGSWVARHPFAFAKPIGPGVSVARPLAEYLLIGPETGEEGGGGKTRGRPRDDDDDERGRKERTQPGFSELPRDIIMQTMMSLAPADLVKNASQATPVGDVLHNPSFLADMMRVIGRLYQSHFATDAHGAEVTKAREMAGAVADVIADTGPLVAHSFMASVLAAPGFSPEAQLRFMGALDIMHPHLSPYWSWDEIHKQKDAYKPKHDLALGFLRQPWTATGPFNGVRGAALLFVCGGAVDAHYYMSVDEGENELDAQHTLEEAMFENGRQDNSTISSDVLVSPEADALLATYGLQPIQPYSTFRVALRLAASKGRVISTHDMIGCYEVGWVLQQRVAGDNNLLAVGRGIGDTEDAELVKDRILECGATTHEFWDYEEETDAPDLTAEFDDAFWRVFRGLAEEECPTQMNDDE